MDRVSAPHAPAAAKLAGQSVGSACASSFLAGAAAKLATSRQIKIVFAVDAENGPGTSSHSHALPDLDDLDLTGAEKIFANEVDEWDQSDEVWDIRRPAKDQQSTPEASFRV
eukprot:s5006_g4.t1